MSHLTIVPTRERFAELAKRGSVIPVFVDFVADGETPASARPSVGGSTNNYELGLTFEYNGFGRVEGQVGGPGKIPAGTGALVPASGDVVPSSQLRPMCLSSQPALNPNDATARIMSANVRAAGEIETREEGNLMGTPWRPVGGSRGFGGCCASNT